MPEPLPLLADQLAEGDIIDFGDVPPQINALLQQGVAARFAAYTLKAMAFIHLRRNEAPEARRMLAKLAEMGADDGMGNSIVADIAAKM